MGVGGISLWQLLFFVAAALIAVAIIKGITGGGSGERLICTRCGTRGQTRWVIPGSWAIELVLWLLLIVPGLIYSIWRGSARYRVCKACDAREMVPIDTPAGRDLAQRYGHDQVSAEYDPEAKLFAKGSAERAKLAEATVRYRETQGAGKKGHPVSSPADAGYSITGADEPPAPRRSGTPPTGSSTPSGGRHG